MPLFFLSCRKLILKLAFDLDEMIYFLQKPPEKGNRIEYVFKRQTALVLAFFLLFRACFVVCDQRREQRNNILVSVCRKNPLCCEKRSAGFEHICFHAKYILYLRLYFVAMHHKSSWLFKTIYLNYLWPLESVVQIIFVAFRSGSVQPKEVCFCVCR